jgi:hypothetical protein
MPTIAELCRGRLTALPTPEESTTDARIAIMRGNIGIMMEEMGHIPSVYPQTAEAVPAWIDESDRTTSQIKDALKALSKLPDDTLLPSPFKR